MGGFGFGAILNFSLSAPKKPKKKVVHLKRGSGTFCGTKSRSAPRTQDPKEVTCDNCDYVMPRDVPSSPCYM